MFWCIINFDMIVINVSSLVYLSADICSISGRVHRTPRWAKVQNNVPWDIQELSEHGAVYRILLLISRWDTYRQR